MKKPLIFTFLICSFLLVFTCFSAPLWAGETLTSSSAVLIDAESGQILYGKSPYSLYSSGDFDKLLSIITALRTADAPKTLTVSKEALSIYSGSPNLGLSAGETVKLKDMLRAMYLEGHNDAANVVAENIGRLYVDTASADYTALTATQKAQAAVDAYAKLMNQTADELCASTMKATNADGHYYDTQQCSCADVAKLIRNAMKITAFQKLFSTEKYSFSVTPAPANTTTGNTGTSADTSTAATDNTGTADTTATNNTGTADTTATNNNTEENKINLSSGNRLFNGSILYAGVEGGLNAYNSSSEKYHCAVYAVKDGRKLIAVVMNGSEDGVYDDAQALLNLGFYKWKTVSVSNSKLSSLLPDDISSRDLAFSGDFEFLLPNGYNVNDLKAAVAYTENGYLSGTITLTLPADASYAGTVTTISFYEQDEPSFWGPVFKVIGIILLIIAVIAVIYILYRLFNTGNKAYTRRIRLTANKEKEKYLKRFKNQTASLRKPTNQPHPRGNSQNRARPGSKNGAANPKGRPGTTRQRPESHGPHQPPIRHKDTK